VDGLVNGGGRPMLGEELERGGRIGFEEEELGRPFAVVPGVGGWCGLVFVVVKSGV